MDDTKDDKKDLRDIIQDRCASDASELMLTGTAKCHDTETPELSVHETSEQHLSTSETPELTVHRTSESPPLSVDRIFQSRGHIMHTEDLVQCSTAVIFSDNNVIHSSPSSQSNTLVLTSVFNNTPILAVGDPSKTDVSIITKVNPSDLLLPKSNNDHDDDLANNGPVLVSSQSQTTLLIPSYYHENDHLIQVSPNSEPLYQNSSSSTLYGHLAQVHTCQWQVCEEQFLTVEELVDHINNTHVLTSKESCEYSCQWKNCVRQGKGFNARYKLLIHLRTHTGERPHACHFEQCDKRFSRLENLKIHCRTHTGEKPYVCPFEGCEKRYSNSSDRFKHTRTHIESKPYRCKVDGCFKQYTDPSSLRKHLKAHKL
ncbi:zinc finger protein GLIS2 homolog [Dendronephthya gigantea]|uniref:zinc finger protein GLIS2 homolog n=1 Tax=Dendronephthya gigantea TaxID=151771 RepID=UPI0010695EF3|nr:zinc finger protein GLIS2 homolog [Dendronephthya gigantea]